MPLIEDANGNHRFVMPQSPNGSIDIENLVAPRVRLPSSRPIGTSPFQEVDLRLDLGGAWAGAHYFRWDLSERRGQWLQRGYLEDPLDCISFADRTMVIDNHEIGRHPFKISDVGGIGLAGPAVYGTHFQGAYLGSRFIMACSEQNYRLYEDTGVYEPTIVAVAAYTPPAVGAYPLCLESVNVVGVTNLWLGLYQGTNTLQWISGLNPQVSGTYAVGSYSTWGLCQTPVDGDSVQVYQGNAAGNANVLMINTDVAPGAATIYTRVALPGGGYTVGLVNVNPNPEVWYVVPENGSPALLDLSLNNGQSFVPSLFRGKMIRVDLRGFTSYPVATSTSFVKWATTGRFGVFYCNGTTHYYMVRGSDIRVNYDEDRPRTNANISRVCRGHWHKDDKFQWQEDEYDLSNNLVTTSHRYEYDIYLNRAYPVSKNMVFSYKGIVSLGGHRMPSNPFNDHNLSFQGGEWLAQAMPASGLMGYGLRHTDGAASTSSRKYEASAYDTTPAMMARKYPRATFHVHRIIGPPRANLRTGSGTEAGMSYRNAYCTVDVSKTPQAVFRGDAAYEGRGQHLFISNDSWTPELQATITSYRDTGGTNAEHYTPNPYPVTIEGIFVEDGFPLPKVDAIKELAAMMEDA